ncbi:hypothetical protein KPA93_25355 [Burkholderia cenocepacia]|uniref:hypothetical protein n=1 Tax=Burkholderia cenocepacia TaxID=95486 RepID=UPI002865C564|nr:hypothetical protein [Burkholderia cenocepacia]MDR8026550.1 hypothetical protein [Burkholderia cenocepacia]MDR8043804.1 hypothetical protein [Burkholderia cenocepacia]
MNAMNAMNDKMHLLLQRKSAVEVGVPEGLKEILNAGFVRIGECILFSSFFKETSLPSDQFLIRAYGDLTGYECAVNKIHVEDYCEENVLGSAVGFVSYFSEVWRGKFGDEAIVILTYEEDNDFGEVCTFRFHLNRVGQKFIDPGEINKYPEAILMSSVL